MRVIFLTPHLRISGGVKVICRFAHELANLGIETAVLPRKEKYKDMEWLSYTPHFRLLSFKNLDLDYVNSSTCVVHYQGSPAIEDFTIPEVLLLQGFVSEDEKQLVSDDQMDIGRKPRLVITVSKWLKDLVLKKYDVPTEVIHPGVDAHFTHKAVAKSRMVTIGSLYSNHKGKNFELFAQSIEDLYFNHKIRVYPIILTADPVAKIRVFDKLCIPYTIIKTPPQDLLPYVYSSCHLWISPSALEGFGLTTLEAMACGVPTLWYPSQGLAQHMQHGYNCIAVAHRKAIVNWVRKLIMNVGLYQSISKRGVHTAQQFKWGESAKRFAAVLTDTFGE